MATKKARRSARRRSSRTVDRRRMAKYEDRKDG
jgi:hypothetical protein